MSPKKAVLIAGILTTIFVIPFACKTQKATPVVVKPIVDCANPQVSFSKDIQLIITNNCTRCHNERSLNGNFTNYEGLSQAAKNGQLEKHVLLRQDMPPNGPLPESDRMKIRCWLNEGSPNN